MYAVLLPFPTLWSSDTVFDAVQSHALVFVAQFVYLRFNLESSTLPVLTQYVSDTLMVMSAATVANRCFVRNELVRYLEVQFHLDP